MDIKRLRIEPKTYSERRNYIVKKGKIELTNRNPPKKREGTNTLVIDNGAYTIKIGNSINDQPKILPNHVTKAKSERKRCFIADQIDDCRDLSGLFYMMPCEYGYITKFDVQKTIWDYTFSVFPVDESPVIMTQPIFNFKHVQEYMDEIFYEEYDVKSMYRANPTDLSQYFYVNKEKGQETPCIVVDSGFSFTHIVPYIDGQKCTNGIIRMNIGGKLLTNYLKDILSYRQLHVMEETHVINQLKEDTCFMAYDFKNTMKLANTTNDVVVNYVLPDFHNIRRGFIKENIHPEMMENCQILVINNERFSVPEVLMQPSIIPGMDLNGLAQCITKSIESCPKMYRKSLANNVVLTGGNTLFKGFKERVAATTKMFLPSNYDLDVFQPEDPTSYAWQGGKYLSGDSSTLRALLVTKQEYEEYGSNYIYKKFNKFSKIEEVEPVETEEKPFSYLEFWKNEQADMFYKEQMKFDSSKNDIEFMLEGDGIEEFNGAYVTLEFEYEETNNEEVKKVEIELSKITNKTTNTFVDTPPPLKVFKKKRIIINPESTPPTLTLIKPDVPSTIIKSPAPINTIAPKVYKPIFRQKILDSKVTRIISLGNPVTLNGTSLIVPNKANVKTVAINSNQIINNTVILPSNMLTSKNITVQIIPFRPEMLRQGNNIILTKKS